VTFSARQALADLDLRHFEFEDMDGVLRHLPHLKLLNAAQLNKALEGDLEGALKGMVDPAALAALLAMPVGVQAPLALAWIAHAEAAPGESPDSSPSSASTASPSKPTSRAGTGSKTRKR
jgi:hypothetical protein